MASRGLALVVPPRRLWQCGDVRAREKTVGSTSAARGTPVGATTARARDARRRDPVGATSGPSGRHARVWGTPVVATSAPGNARRGDARARRGRASGRRSCLRTRATSAHAGDARPGDVSAGAGLMSCSTGRGDVRAQGTPVGARSARAGGARRRARGKGACDRACSGLPLVFVREGPPSGPGQGADGRTRRGRPPGHPDDHARVSKTNWSVRRPATLVASRGLTVSAPAGERREKDRGGGRGVTGRGSI